MRKGLLHRAVSKSAHGLGLTRITMKPVMVNGRRIFLSNDDEALVSPQSPKTRSRTKKAFVELRVLVSLWRDSWQHTTRPLPGITGLI